MENEPANPKTSGKAKHLIITGGGPIGFISYGVVRSMAKRDVYSHETIQTFHGVSSGGILCAILSCGVDWHLLDDYLIKRPWEELLYVSPERLFAAFANNGVFGDDLIESVMEPLLQCLELTTDVSLKEFHSATGKTIVLYAHDLNAAEFDLYPVSHVTHPDMKLVTAIRATCALPIILQPVSVRGAYLIDGGVVTNVPVNASIQFIKSYIGDKSFDMNDVWVVRKNVVISAPSITSPKNILYGAVAVMRNLCRRMTQEALQQNIPNSIVVDTFDVAKVETWLESMNSIEKRRNLVEGGSRLSDGWFASE